MSLFHWLRPRRTRTRAGAPRPALSSPLRPRLETLEDRLAPAATVVANATSSLLNAPAHFSLYDNGVLTVTRGTATSVVARGVQGVYQGADASSNQVAYALIGHTLREYTPNHGWVMIGTADQAAADTSGNVFFRQAGSLLHATGVPASTSAAYQVMASFGVQALTQFSPSQVLFLQNGVLAVLSGSTQPTTIQHAVKALAQDGYDQVLFLDGGGGLNIVAPGMNGPKPLTLDVQALAQSAPNQAVYLTADGTLMSTTAGSTPTAITTGVQELAQGRNQTAYVIHNGVVAEVTATGKLASVAGTANIAHLIVDGQQQVYAISTGNTLERINGLAAQAIAWNVSSYAIDSAGELVALDGPAVYHYFTGQYTVGGISTAVQFALDASGNLYSIDRSGNLAMATSSKSTLLQIATGVTQVALDSAGELVYLTGPYVVNYVSGGLYTSNSSVAINGNPPPVRFALDLHGNLYTLADGVLTVTATSDPSKAQQLATGVLGMAANFAGQVVAITGPHSYAYYGGLVGGGGSSTTAQYAVDPAGNLYTLYPSGALFAAATAATPPRLVDTGVTRMAMDVANEVVVLHGSAAYEYLLGPLATNNLSPHTTYAMDSHGDLYSLHAGTVTTSTWSGGPVRTLATGVSQMFMDQSGDVAFLFGSTGQLSYYDPVGQKPIPILANQEQVVVDAHGQLYSRGNSGVVSQISPQGPVAVDYLARSIWLWYGNVHATYTTIGQYWHNLLAVHKQLGMPTGPEHDVAGGRAAEFQSGEVTWSPQTGIRVIPVEFRRTYDNLNGPSSYLGMPVSGVLLTHDKDGIVDGEVQYFQGGAMFMSNTGVVTPVSLHIAQAYQYYQRGSDALGAAESSQAIADTAVEEVTFDDGIIYWSPATGARLIADAKTQTWLTPSSLALDDNSWSNPGAVINNALGQNFGIQFSATGTLSMNLAQQTAYAKVDFAGTQFDSAELESLLDGAPDLPNIPNPLDVLVSLGRTGVSISYATQRDAYYHAYGADNVYFSSARFVDWTSPETMAELIGATAIGAGDLAYNTLQDNLSAELQGIIAWATRRFGNEATAIQQIGQAFATGHWFASAVPVQYTYSLFGHALPGETHYGFVLGFTGFPSGPLAPQANMIGTATTAAAATQGVSTDDIQGLLGQFAITLANQVLHTNIDASAFNLGNDVLSNLANTRLYQDLFNTLGISEQQLAQAYGIQGSRPIINLTQSAGVQNLVNTVNGWLGGGDLHFRVTSLQFNTSTYELSAQIVLDYAHNWGSFTDIVDKVGNTLWTLGQSAGQHVADWFKQETGFLANWWHNTQTVIPGATWVANAIDSLPQVADDLGSAAEPYVKGIADEAKNAADSPAGQVLDAIFSGHYSFGLTDEQLYGFIPVH